MRLPAALLATCLLAAPGLTAQVATLQFADGNGTSSVDQWTGTAGGGWLGGWVAAVDSGSLDVNHAVSTADPFTGGGGTYLSASSTILGTFGGQSRNGFYRQYNGVGLGDLLTFRWNFRIDSTTGCTNAFTDNIKFMDTSNQQVFNPGSSTTATWFLELRGAAGNLTVRARNGGATVDTANVFAIGTDYAFQVTSNPSTKTYSFNITDMGTSSVVASGANLSWWNSGESSHGGTLNFITGIEGNSVGDHVHYALDGVAISAVPEPSTYALLGLGLGALLGLRRRSRP